MRFVTSTHLQKFGGSTVIRRTALDFGPKADEIIQPE